MLLFFVVALISRGSFLSRSRPEDASVCGALFEVLKRVVWCPPWRAALGLPMSPLTALLALVERATTLYATDFECLAALAEFQVELMVAAASDPPLMAAVTAHAPAIITAHVLAVVDGNPLAVRFHRQGSAGAYMVS